MTSALRKTMEYLGLSEPPEAHDYDDYYEEPHAAVPAERDRHEGATVSHLQPRSAPSPVRNVEMGALNRITTIHPRTYNEAKEIGEAFRDNTPVIMNLSDMDDADAKRLVDFAAGLIFGLRGSIERVTSKVFLLSPQHVEVIAEESADPRSARGFFNQS